MSVNFHESKNQHPNIAHLAFACGFIAAIDLTNNHLNEDISKKAIKLSHEFQEKHKEMIDISLKKLDENESEKYSEIYGIISSINPS